MIRVMIIHGTRAERDYYRKTLCKEGVEVIEASNRDDAVQLMVQKWRIHVVILDYFLADDSTTQLIDELKESAEPAPLPVLTVSAPAGPRMLSAALGAGANHYLEEPIEPELLLTSVSALSGGRL